MMHRKDKKTILLTGGTAGLGLEAAKLLAQSGARVVITARTPEKGDAACAAIRAALPDADIHVLIADLSVLSSVRNLAQTYTERFDRLDVLINNAGVMEHEPRTSADGYELDAAVDYFAPFLLSHLLLPLVLRSAPARIINVVSSLHREGHIDLSTFGKVEYFDKYKSYADAKLALILFSRTLIRTLANKNILVYPFHPGVVDTKMTAKNKTAMSFPARVLFAVRRTVRRPERAARPLVFLATTHEGLPENGAYRYADEPGRLAPQALDEEMENKLYHWTCEKLNVAPILKRG